MRRVKLTVSWLADRCGQEHDACSTLLAKEVERMAWYAKVFPEGTQGFLRGVGPPPSQHSADVMWTEGLTDSRQSLALGLEMLRQEDCAHGNFVDEDSGNEWVRNLRLSRI